MISLVVEKSSNIAMTVKDMDSHTLWTNDSNVRSMAVTIAVSQDVK